MGSTLQTIGSILGRVGSAIVKDVVPGGGLILDAINAFLPTDKQLPANATGAQATAAVATLPPDRQAEILSKEIDLDIAEVNAWAQVQGSLAEADKSGASTRPRVALQMSACVVFAVIIAISAWAIAIFTKNAIMLKAVQESWPLVATVIGTPTFLLKTYFGARMKEKQSRYAAAMGRPVPPSTNILADVVRAIKGVK